MGPRKGPRKVRFLVREVPLDTSKKLVAMEDQNFAASHPSWNAGHRKNIQSIQAHEGTVST